MKSLKILGFVLSSTLLFTSIGCVRNFEIVRGNGIVTGEARPISSFSTLDVSGSFRIQFSISDTFSLQISAESNFLPLIETTVSNNRLKIKAIDGFSLLESQPLIISITGPSISEINLSGTSNFLNTGTIETNNFRANLSGSSKLETGVIANKVYTNISGSGSVKLSAGNSQTSKHNISGSATIEATEHITQIANIGISGSGKIWLHVTEHLDVNISGSGEVNYLGNPTIDSAISGSGRIKKI